MESRLLKTYEHEKEVINTLNRENLATVPLKSIILIILPIFRDFRSETLHSGSDLIILGVTGHMRECATHIS